MENPCECCSHRDDDGGYCIDCYEGIKKSEKKVKNEIKNEKKEEK